MVGAGGILIQRRVELVKVRRIEFVGWCLQLRENVEELVGGRCGKGEA